MADKFSPMTDEQRRRWRDEGVFPVERWSDTPGSTPLVCPLPDRELLRKLAEAIPAHIQTSGWYATAQRYEHRTVHAEVYGDDFRGMGRQAIASVISSRTYSGPLADYIAAACPRTMLALLDRIAALESALNHALTRPPVLHALATSSAMSVQTERQLRRALRFYAAKEHFAVSDHNAWDTVSGEPQNYWCDDAGTAMVEDGSIAAMALRGAQLVFEDDEEPPMCPGEPEHPISPIKEGGA